MKCISTVCLCFVVGAPAVALAQNVYRCTDGATISYQWHACALHETEQLVFPGSTGGSVAAEKHAGNVVPPPLPQRPKANWRAQVRSASPYVGITDMAVLNMRGWGRPHKITRERGARSWHEHWIYQSRDGTVHHLHFGNGALLAMRTEPPPQVVQVVSAAEPPVLAEGSD